MKEFLGGGKGIYAPQQMPCDFVVRVENKIHDTIHGGRGYAPGASAFDKHNSVVKNKYISYSAM